ncbi:MAG: carboxypeptidase-like regulatory domain-containing protein [Rhodopseudomonas palustris]|nr:carboxypeptidase-like regulatory domain-containing protein [Rhodopseudomonas palustris]
MRKFLVVLSLLLLAVTVSAQVRTGNIYGKITDSEGNPLPGVSVTLTGPQMAPDDDGQRRDGHLPLRVRSPRQRVRDQPAELSGFKKADPDGHHRHTRRRTSEINLTMEVGAHRRAGHGRRPDARRRQPRRRRSGHNINKEMLQSLPSARDPWVVMQLAPAIHARPRERRRQRVRPAVGLPDQGRHGQRRLHRLEQHLDGRRHRHHRPGSSGGSALYYDFDMFEELNITTGGAADVEHPDRRHRPEHGHPPRRQQDEPGRPVLPDRRVLPGENLTPELIGPGRHRLPTRSSNIKDFGFNAGGPLVKDKVWWWGAYGVQDIFVYTIYQTQGPVPPQQLQLQDQRPDPGQQPLRGPGHARAPRRSSAGTPRWPSPKATTREASTTGAARSSSCRTSTSSATTCTCP